MALKRMPVPRDVVPEEQGRVVRLVWQDGHESPQPAFNLRAACPCAVCVDEMTGRRILQVESVDPGVAVTAYQRVGRYALQFEFSDGHRTGIYTYEALRETCPCTACREARGEPAGNQETGKDGEAE